MNTWETLTEILGWCLILNAGLLAVTTVMLIVAKDSIAKIHARMFALDEAVLRLEYFKYIACYKIGIILLNLTPYIALKIVL